MLTIFTGLESRDHRRTMESVRDSFGNDAPSIAVGIGWRSLKARRMGPQYVKDVAALFPVVLDSACASATYDRDAAKAAQDEYYHFLASVPEVISAIQFEHPSLLVEDRILPEDSRVIPVLFDYDDPDALAAVLKDYNAVAMTYKGDKRIPPVLRRDTTPSTVSIALNISDLEVAARAGFNMASTSAWHVPGQYGDAVVWNGQRVVRSKPHNRPNVLREQRQWLEAVGFDLDLLKADDAREWNRVAIHSYLLWGAHLGSSEQSLESDPSGSENGATGESSKTVSVANPAKAVKHVREQIPLPVFTTEPVSALEPDHFGGTSSIRTRNITRSSTETLRVCDTCFLSATCPASKPAASCAFNLPVEIRTDAQAKALMYTMVEIQASRVAFARYAEEINGGYPDPVVGQEMDRLLRMTERVTKPNERRERLTVSVEAESSGAAEGAGVLSRIFGERAQAPVDPPPVTVIEAIDVSAD